MRHRTPAQTEAGASTSDPAAILPRMDRYTLRSRNPDGTVKEVSIEWDQAHDLAAGRPIAYTPRDAHVAIEDDGTVVHREDARPRLEDAA